MWASGVREEALGFLRDFTARMSNDLRVGNTGLLARCYSKKGEWQKILQEDWDKVCNIHLKLSFKCYILRFLIIINCKILRKLFLIFCNHICLQHNMIKTGIKPGIHGLSQISKLFLFMRNLALLRIMHRPIKILQIPKKMRAFIKKYCVM